MHIKLTTLTFVLLSLFLNTRSTWADSKYYSPNDYEVFFAKGGPKCGLPVLRSTSSDYVDYRIISRSQSCVLVLKARKELEKKLHYWINYRPLGKEAYRRLSSIKVFSNKYHNGSELVSFKMKGDGYYDIVFDSNQNGYPDEYVDIGLLLEPNTGGN